MASPEAATPPVAAEPDAAPAWVDLSRYTPGDYRPGRGRFTQVAWYFTSWLLFESGWFVLTGAKPTLLRWFGARIGRGVVIKPHVRIKYPWRLAVGDHCWIGEESWIDNLADVRLGDHVCLSQRAYLCTGGHDHHRVTFDLTPGAITLENGSWVGAGALVLGGVTVGANAVVAAGSVAPRSLDPGGLYAGVPAKRLGDRSRPA